MLCFVISSRRVGMSRSMWRMLLGMYHGASVIVLKTLFWKRCKISMLEWESLRAEWCEMLHHGNPTDLQGWRQFSGGPNLALWYKQFGVGGPWTRCTMTDCLLTVQTKLHLEYRLHQVCSSHCNFQTTRTLHFWRYKLVAILLARASEFEPSVRFVVGNMVIEQVFLQVDIRRVRQNTTLYYDVMCPVMYETAN